MALRVKDKNAVIQLAFMTQTPVVTRDVQHPLTWLESDGAWFLTGVWEEADFEAARQDMALALRALAEDTLVKNVFTGRIETAPEAATRLELSVTLESAFLFHGFDWQGLHFLHLRGLNQLGFGDIFLEIESDVRPKEVRELLTDLVQYLRVTGRAFKPGEPIPYGYWLLSTASASLYGAAFWTTANEQDGCDMSGLACDPRLNVAPPLFIIEVKDVTTSDYEWGVGASRAIRIMALQNETHGRLAAITDTTMSGLRPAFAQDPVVACRRFMSEQRSFGYREESLSDEDSGWRFGCDDEAHTHDEESMVMGVVSQVVTRNHQWLQYLASPPGWVISFDERGFWVQSPGSDESFLDEASYPGEPWLPHEGYAVVSS
jgi:hypothetical protein